MRRRTTVVSGWLGKLVRAVRDDSTARDDETSDLPASLDDAQVAASDLLHGGPAPRSEERKSAPSGPVPKPLAARVLVIDDEPQVARAIKRILYRHQVAIATTGEEALALLRAQRFDVIISDVMMPEPAGLDVYELLLREGSPLVRRFVFVTGGVYGPKAREFLARIPNERLDKPVDPIALDLAIARVMHTTEPRALHDAG